MKVFNSALSNLVKPGRNLTYQTRAKVVRFLVTIMA